MRRNWEICKPDPEIVRTLSAELNCSTILATILVNRGFAVSADAERFLETSLDGLPSPFSIIDMDRAVERIVQAIDRNEKILIFGDYDADGVTATALLLDFLRIARADVDTYIPHRIEEGYGLQPTHIDTVAVPEGAKLIITVDCGSSDHMALKAAAEAGIDTIVTDHHIITEELPEAFAIVNPKRRDCPSGCDMLSGAGVAFYLTIALRKHMRDAGLWRNRGEPNLKQYCDLVAIGTVADIVPLLNDNRILTRWGVEEINRHKRPGVRALTEIAGVSRRPVETDDIAFRLAPRLNAAGRMDHADAALALLMETDPEQADRLAEYLDSLNRERQDVEDRLLKQALSDIHSQPSLRQQKSLVLSYRDWPEGVLGIIASRLARQFYRPSILISVRDGMGKGSGRSIPGFDLYNALSACADTLSRFGGHKMAAGLSLEEAQISRFADRFEAFVSSTTTADDFVETSSVDCCLDPGEITPGLIDELERLKPFGTANPDPIFAMTDVAVVSSRIVGRNHRRMRIRSASDRSGRALDAIHFNIDPDEPMKSRYESMFFRLGWNYWNGNKTIQMTVEDMR